MKVTFNAKRSNIYPYEVDGAAHIHFVAEQVNDEQELRKLYSAYVGRDKKVRVNDMPKFGEQNGIKQLTLTIDT